MGGEHIDAADAAGYDAVKTRENEAVDGAAEQSSS